MTHIDKDIYYDDIEIVPYTLEQLREIEMLILKKEVKDDVQKNWWGFNTGNS